jgi:phosphoserine phosphatase RsbU/P
MKVLIAEDDPISRRLLEATLHKWGHEVVVTADGAAAWQALQDPGAPALAILDWMMPGLDGLEVCRRVRQARGLEQTYLILLTALTKKNNVVTGLASGANDFVTKPFDPEELRARVEVGVRVVQLHRALTERVRELEDALGNVKQLQGLLPICAWCKNIRNDKNYWQRVEDYLAGHTHAQFTHAICPECLKKEVAKEEAARRQAAAQQPPALGHS